MDLDHVALATRNVTPALGVLVGELGGIVLFGGQGPGFRPMQVRLGDAVHGMTIELLEPWEVEGNDFLDRFLERHGEGPHHLTFKVDDLESALKRARGAGYRPVGIDVSDPDWKEAFLHPREAHGIEVTRLPEPPWRGGAATGSATVRLQLVSTRPNEITDEAAWFARNRLELREHRVPGRTYVESLGRRPLPRGTPTSFRGQELTKAIRQRDTLLLAYGQSATVRYLVASRGGEERYGFDFVNYGAPRGAGEYQSLDWAVERAGVLYVSHSHVTFARATGGRNGYLTAIDLRSRKVLWRSRPLVANAETFEVVGNVIITGYGFTEEPDYLYLLDRRTGGVVQRLPVPSAPAYILRRGRELYVRTYDRDLVVELTRRR